jgi:PKD domain/L,D-transpeptidase catalytic domain/Putative peptidoglycan binding domain
VRPALLCVLALVLAPAAHAAPPTVAASASARTGAAPLQVTLQVTGDAATYSWQLGDGATAEGPVVQHVYAQPGVYTATVTGTSATGEVSTAQVVVTALRLRLAGPAGADFDARVRFRGSLAPAIRGTRVTLVRGRRAIAATKVAANGSFVLRVRIASPGPFQVRAAGIASPPVRVRIKPVLVARLTGGQTVGSRLKVEARVLPAGAGRLRVDVRRPGHRVQTRRSGARAVVRLDTREAGALRVRVSLVPRPGYSGRFRSLAATVVQPNLGVGSRGESVRALQERLRELHYALPGVNGSYDTQTVEAVLAFQKVEGLPWTARVDEGVWRRLAAAHVPRARYPGDHIEVSKGRQYLLQVQGGLVRRVVHVSTGATGNTPIGTWHVYRKVVGWDWVLWYPMYFLRGFAIHGYPSVPAFPASHGCVRVPMWVAPQLFAQNPYGETVHIYW